MRDNLEDLVWRPIVLELLCHQNREAARLAAALQARDRGPKCPAPTVPGGDRLELNAQTLPDLCDSSPSQVVAAGEGFGAGAVASSEVGAALFDHLATALRAAVDGGFEDRHSAAGRQYSQGLG